MPDPIKPEPGPLPETARRCPWCNGRILSCMGESWCEDEVCPLSHMVCDWQMDLLIQAIERNNRIKAGLSIELLKVRGQFPDLREFPDRVEARGTGIHIQAPTAPQAAALWNNLAKDRP